MHHIMGAETSKISGGDGGTNGDANIPTGVTYKVAQAYSNSGKVAYSSNSGKVAYNNSEKNPDNSKNATPDNMARFLNNALYDASSTFGMVIARDEQGRVIDRVVDVKSFSIEPYEMLTMIQNNPVVDTAEYNPGFNHTYNAYTNNNANNASSYTHENNNANTAKKKVIVFFNNAIFGHDPIVHLSNLFFMIVKPFKNYAFPEKDFKFSAEFVFRRNNTLLHDSSIKKIIRTRGYDNLTRLEKVARHTLKECVTLLRNPQKLKEPNLSFPGRKGPQNAIYKNELYDYITESTQRCGYIPMDHALFINIYSGDIPVKSKEWWDMLIFVLRGQSKPRLDYRVNSVTGVPSIKVFNGHSKHHGPPDECFHKLDTEKHPVVYHGTSMDSAFKIINSGFMSPMDRSHVHMGLSTEVVEGYRKGEDVVILVDTAGLRRAGRGLLINDGGVVLSSKPIAIKYLLFNVRHYRI